MRFYGGRFSLLADDNSIFYMKGNENKFSFILNELRKNIEFRARKDTYIIIEPIIDDNGNLLGGKIGRTSKTKLPLRSKGNFTKVSTTIFPHVTFIIDETEQLIFIEYDSQVFSEPLVVFKYLRKYLNSRLIDKGIEVDIKPLTTKGEFWKLLNDLDQVYSISFKLKAPNFLGQSYRGLRTILEEQKKITNANEIEFGLSNESGNLKIKNPDQYSEIIGWIEDGGGEWIVKGKNQNFKRKQNFSNTNQLSSFVVNINVEEITIENINIIKNLINIGSHRIKDVDTDD